MKSMRYCETSIFLVISLDISTGMLDHSADEQWHMAGKTCKVLNLGPLGYNISLILLHTVHGPSSQ